MIGITLALVCLALVAICFAWVRVVRAVNADWDEAQRQAADRKGPDV